jgi:hypothetical protein
MADKSKRLSDDELITILRKEEAAARSYQDGTLSPIRTEAQSYYDREPYGDEQEGSSQVVTSEFQDVVEGIMPGLMEVFAGGDQVVQFIPEAAGQEKFAEEASDYVSHCFMQKNNGFVLLYGMIKDALMSRLGGLMVDLEDCDEAKTVEARGLPQSAIDLIVAKAKEQDAELEMALVQDEAPAVNPDSGAPFSEPTFSGPITITRRSQKVVCESLAPEDILFTPTARDQDKCSYQGYMQRTTASALVKLGMTWDEVRDLRSDRADTPEEDQRTDSAAAAAPERQDDDDSERVLWLVVAYVKADFDGSGISTMERVLYAHAGGQAARIIEREPWDGPAPIVLASPILMPHAIVGRSLFDQTKDLQQVGSVLTRGFLNNLYQVNTPRPIVDDQVLLDTMLDWTPGTPVRLKAGARASDGHVAWLQVPSIMADALNGLEYMATVRENRTGTSRHNQGLEADSLNKTKGGMQMLMSAGAQRQKLTALVLAQTAIARIYRLIYIAQKKAATGPVEYWSQGKFRTVDPTKWPPVMDLTVNVGLGTGNTQQELEHLMVLASVQEKLVALQGGAGGPFVMPENIANLAQKIAEKLGFKTPGMFFQPADKVTEIAQQQQPKPDPEMVKVQGQLAAQAEKQKGDLELARAEAAARIAQRREEAAAELQIMRERAALEMQLERDKAAANAVLAREEAEREAQLEVWKIQNMPKPGNTELRKQEVQ